MSYKLLKSQTSNDVKENKSVRLIADLLEDNNAVVRIGTNEKTPYIDGYIELLNNHGIIQGKITVQVKTVSKKEEGKNRFPCPTSLFAYAEVNSEVVLLLAIDHANKIVLWKHISRQLIEDNRNKEQQQTITLHFTKAERLTQENVEDTLKQWKLLSQNTVKTLADAPKILKENEALRKLIVNSENSQFDLSEEEVYKIQLFSDTYNYLYDNDLLFFKKLLFHDCWKTGLAIFKYDDCELIHSLFPIRYGENSLLIKQLPLSEFNNCKDPFVSMDCEKNRIKDNPVLFAMEHIENQVSDFIKTHPIIPNYDVMLIEYVRDICWQYAELKIKKEQFDNIERIICDMKQNFPGIADRSPNTTYGYNNLNIGYLYDTIILLKQRGYTKIPSIYPEHGHSGLTGHVSDSFSIETAFKKLQNVVNIAYSALSRFIDESMPLTLKKQNGIHKANLIIYDLDYSSQSYFRLPSLNTYYFEDRNDKSKFLTECYIHPDLQIASENNVKTVYDLWKLDNVNHNGRSYKLIKTGGCDINKYIFDHFNIIMVFNELLQEYLTAYFETIKR